MARRLLQRVGLHDGGDPRAVRTSTWRTRRARGDDPRAVICDHEVPNITLSISRQAFAFSDDRNPPFSGALPWANSPEGTDTSPAVSNPLADNPDGYLVINKEEYTSGNEALEKLREATSQLSQVTDSIKTHGNLAWNFENEQRETGVAPPYCPLTLPNTPISKGEDPNTICWRFNDGDA